MKFVRKLVKTKVFHYFIVFSIENVYAYRTNLANSLYFHAFSVLPHILPRGAKNKNPTILRTLVSAGRHGDARRACLGGRRVSGLGRRAGRHGDARRAGRRGLGFNHSARSLARARCV